MLKRIIASLLIVGFIAFGAMASHEAPAGHLAGRTVVEVLNGESGESLSGLSFISGGRLNTYLFSNMGTGDVINIIRDITKVEDRTDIRKMVLYINSGGGNAFTGLALADVIRAAQARGWTVEGSASGIVASAAVPVFAVCNPRIAAPGTIFMVHEAALWKWPGRESASDIRAQGELMAILKKQYLDIMVSVTDLTYSEWEVMEIRTSWFNAKRAISIGLADIMLDIGEVYEPTDVIQSDQAR